MAIKNRFGVWGDYGVDIRYPHNSLREAVAYDCLLDNINKVPVEEIEKLIQKYNLL